MDSRDEAQDWKAKYNTLEEKYTEIVDCLVKKCHFDHKLDILHTDIKKIIDNNTQHTFNDMYHDEDYVKKYNELYVSYSDLLEKYNKLSEEYSRQARLLESMNLQYYLHNRNV